MPDEKVVFTIMPRRIHEALLPFSEPFETLLLPAIWEHGGVPADGSVTQLARRLRRHVRRRAGHPTHASLICYGLRLCCHYHIRAAETRCRGRDYELHRELIDAAYGTIAKLEEHFGTYELRLLLS